MKNKNRNEPDPSSAADKYVIDLERNRFDKYGNRSGIKAWRYDHDKSMWSITRNYGEIEYNTLVEKRPFMTRNACHERLL